MLASASRARRRERRALVEGHHDVGAEQPLDLHAALGAQVMERAVDVAAEGDPLLGELPELGQAHHLEAARIGQDRPLPVHEAVQPAEPRHPLGPRPQHQMIGVAEQDVGAGGADALGQHRLDRAGGADRHEGGGADSPRGVSSIPARARPSRAAMVKRISDIRLPYCGRPASTNPQQSPARPPSFRESGRGQGRRSRGRSPFTLDAGPTRSPTMEKAPDEAAASSAPRRRSFLLLQRRNPRLRPSAARARRRHLRDAGAPLPPAGRQPPALAARSGARLYPAGAFLI